MKRFLSDSFRRDIDNGIHRLIVNHKVKETHRDWFIDLDAHQVLSQTFTLASIFRFMPFIRHN